MAGSSLRSISQNILEYRRNLSASLLNNWSIIKSVQNGDLRNLHFEPIPHPPYSPDLALAIFIIYLFFPLYNSKMTSRIIITTRETMGWRPLSSPGFEKSGKNISVIEFKKKKKMLRVGSNVLILTKTMLKNKCMILKLKNFP